MPAAGDTPTTVLLVVQDGTEQVVGRIDARRPCLAMVDALARLQLSARRTGCAVRLRDVTPQLRGLLELTGLGGVFAVEPGREPELGEELGVQEVVEPGDAPV